MASRVSNNLVILVSSIALVLAAAGCSKKSPSGPTPPHTSKWAVQNSGILNRGRAVWGSSGNDVFAVGSRGTIVHYDGTAWSPMNSGSDAELLGVWGSSSSDVFAVGYSATGGTILHYNGTTWSTMASGSAANLCGVWGNSGSDVFAVGDGCVRSGT
jgi:hypothetical protein